MAKKFSPVPLPDFLAEVESNAEWLIPNLLPSGGLTLLSGPPKRGNKTYQALLMAIGLTANKKVMAQERTSKNVPILFVEEEGASSDLKKRIASVLAGYKIPPEKTSKLFWAYRNRVELNDHSFLTEITNFILTNQIKLVVFDTFSTCFFGDENDVKEVALAMKTIYAITKLNVAVLLLVHHKKGASLNADMDDKIRGSSHIAASYDCHICVHDRKDSQNEYRLNVQVRSRTQEDRNGIVVLNFGINDEGQEWVTGKCHFEESKNDSFKAQATSLVIDDMEKIPSSGRKRKVLDGPY